MDSYPDLTRGIRRRLEDRQGANKIARFRMRGITLMLMLMIFCLSPLTLLAQRLVITPADVTVEKGGRWISW